MHTIPVIGWVAIAILAIFIIILYFALFTIMRDPGRFREITQRKMRSSGQSISELRKVSDTMRDPFGGERKQLNELSSIVHDLQEPYVPPTDSAAEKDSSKE